MTAVVVGGGVAGLVAAHRLWRRGHQVVLLEAGERLGGRVAPVELGGLTLDGGAESFAVRGGTVHALVDELGLGGDVVEPEGSAWVALADRTVPLPAGGLLGIPSSPLASDVQRVIGFRGGARAYADRLLPVLKVGRYPMLGPLVRARMGATVLERLVAPVVSSVYGVDPDEAPVDLIAPGLNAAITRTGTLSSAVLALRSAAPPGSAAQGLAGGVHRLVGALEQGIAGADVRLGVRATALRPDPGSGGWLVEAGEEVLVADRVVLAADGGAALDLLGEAVPGLALLHRPEPVSTRTVLLLVDDARLDSAPRGTGVLRAAERTGVVATALTHVSAKWPWLAASLPAHRHVLRLAYRGAAEVRDHVALADLAGLLGFTPASPRARADLVWRDSAPALAAETVAVRRALASASMPRGLAVAGAWTAGTGLASVIASAERAAAPV